MAATLLSLDNDVFRAFATYATVVVVKTMLMSGITAVTRFKNKAFINPEDAASMKDKDGKPLKPFTHQDVERVRRCHLNDLENVIPFVLIGLLYVTTNPSLSTALLHFRIFAAARILHTFAYLIPLPQPSRAMLFMAGLLATLSMAYNVFSKGLL
ncbi:hypothetical protein BaRGS_00004348 [Batillaria attramentaria]|uniref:Microsomal glutathione S-transferase 1 n=1 Tax=Batillaria attramentaria TaxID=370345 RepID=A0ABD0LYA5_9CAEN